MRETIPAITASELRRMLHLWPHVLRVATDPFAKEFAASIWAQSGHKGWRPSLKQGQVMRAMIRELHVAGILGDEHTSQITEDE